MSIKTEEKFVLYKIVGFKHFDNLIEAHIGRNIENYAVALLRSVYSQKVTHTVPHKHSQYNRNGYNHTQPYKSEQTAVFSCFFFKTCFFLFLIFLYSLAFSLIHFIFLLLVGKAGDFKGGIFIVIVNNSTFLALKDFI